jgi:hypothetical protein
VVIAIFPPLGADLGHCAVEFFMVWVEIAIFSPSGADLGFLCRWVLMVWLEIVTFLPLRADLGHCGGGFCLFGWRYLFLRHQGLIWGIVQVGFNDLGS